MKAVLDTRPGSGYLDTDDRYHFPGRYLKPALDALGQWVVLYEPRREGGRAAYVAAARLAEVTPDPGTPGHHFARLVERLPFDSPVPLRGAASRTQRRGWSTRSAGAGSRPRARISRATAI